MLVQLLMQCICSANALFIVFEEGNGPLTCPYEIRCARSSGARFQSHYSLLKTIEAAYGLPYLGHANDATTNAAGGSDRLRTYCSFSDPARSGA